jgi:peptidoglycan hydrolase-like protein with peptidoglycan-binding domain
MLPPMTLTVGARGIDYATLQASGAQIAADGAQFVCRYLTAPADVAPAAQWKAIGKAEYDDLVGALGADCVWLVYEWYAERCLEGAAAGAQDGAWAYAAARALGYPEGSYIVIAHDTGARDDLAVAAYMRAFAEQQGGFYRADAIYSGIDTCEAMRGMGLASFIWQTLAWSRGEVSPFCNFYQNGKGWYDGGADENVVLVLPGEAPAPAAPTQAMPAGVPSWPLPPGQYFGLISGPDSARGGALSDPQWVNDEIQRLQLILVRNGWAGTGDAAWADGKYEQPTADAMLRFQQAKGLPLSGNIGPGDWAMLYTDPSGGTDPGPAAPAAPAPAPAAPAVPSWPDWVPQGEYFGLVTGPAASHGGMDDREREAVAQIQRKLIALGYAGEVSPGWADGVFEQPTADAVTRFQQDHMPGTQFPGQVWSDDWATLFSL